MADAPFRAVTGTSWSRRTSLTSPRFVLMVRGEVESIEPDGGNAACRIVTACPIR
jgi:hypothetical protein